MSADPALSKPQDPATVNALVARLESGIGKKPKEHGFSCKKSTFTIEDTVHNVDSWKFQEQDFKKHTLPTYARGLFTWRDKVSGNYRIAIRGYDKFFNINEVKCTKWEWIADNTKAPYEVTVKENGCIIFISGLPDGTLLVCSKHSTGAREETEASHAIVGERWVDKQLAQIGKTRRDLAETLYNANVTAVAELCDDSFEEHILAYEGDQAGLYLHGINYNLGDFATYSMPEVHKFAEEWAFRKIDYVVKDDVQQLRKFLEEAAETGSWDGKDVEGFVIRCKARTDASDPNWEDWFFKYKFEEPYLLYRQWRECTKALIAGKEPRYRNHKEITREYLKFASAYFIQNKGAADQYKMNHGIIKLRNAYLAHSGLKGADIVRMDLEEKGTGQDSNLKLVLVPVATIGCGKTTVAHALTKLFGWSHIQNDNLTARKGKPQAFAAACTKALVVCPAVIADRNNHQKRERKQLIDDMSPGVNQAHFVALNYVHHSSTDKDLQDKIREITRKRVLSRGDNHQTIHAATKNNSEIIGIMEGFLNRFQSVDIDEFPDRSFDNVIDLDPLKESRENLETVVKALHHAYPKLVPEIPSAAALDDAIKASFDEYKPAIKHTIKGSATPAPKRAQTQPQQQTSKKVDVDYFSVSLPPSIIVSAVEKAIATAPEEKRAYYYELKSAHRVQQKFHVTLLHNANKSQNKEMWERYIKLYSDAKAVGEPMGTGTIKLESVVWDGRVMAITASLVGDKWECANNIPHVTVGTSVGVKPKESNDMLEGKWRNGDIGVEQIDLSAEGIEVTGKVEGVKNGKF
ncbi:RNA ligase-domain-containing protein [Tricharina praecox]|uniref:RNA ligase-domain-containing protein n=1 Tax=Tricharina praecox TaxID=43433 RepID=UPI00221F48F6|nr:RNA ligase-domain-containing protein [Tricharina praecox]KAI5855748.1 RNA ligase-domain-containing protein [Tricharina praecox]